MHLFQSTLPNMDEFMVKTCNFCDKTMKATLFSVHVKNAHTEDENSLEDLQPKKRKPGPASRTGRDPSPFGHASYLAGENLDTIIHQKNVLGQISGFGLT